MKKLIALLLIFSLAGCFEDKGAILAGCQLKYETDIVNQGVYGDHTNLFLCMREKGFEFESRWTALDKLKSGKTDWCYTTDIPHQPTIPVNELADQANCYHSVWIDSLMEFLTIPKR